MRGTVRKISMPRRLVADLMHASVRVPFVSLTRSVNVRPLLEARTQAARPPGWAAIFVKAFALVAREQPILRTLYVKWPLPGFFELPRSVAMKLTGHRTENVYRRYAIVNDADLQEATRKLVGTFPGTLKTSGVAPLS